MTVAPDRIIVAVLLACLLVLGGVFIVNDLDNNYNVGIKQGDFGPLVTEVNNVYGNASVYVTGAQNSSLPGSISSDTAFDNILAKAYTTANGIWSFFTLPTRLITATIIFFDVPSPFGEIFALLLTISLLFAIIYMIFRFQPR